MEEHIHTYWEFIVFISLNGHVFGPRKPEHPEETHADMRRQTAGRVWPSPETTAVRRQLFKPLKHCAALMHM